MADSSNRIPDEMASFDLLIGTYTDARVPTPGDGLYAASCRDGVIGDVRLVVRTSNPSWLSFDAERAVAYCVNELVDGGALVAFDLTAGADAAPLGTAPTGGEPAHVVMTPDGRFAITADYTGGSVTTIAIDPDGRPGTSDRRLMSEWVAAPGGVSHPHFIGFDPMTGEVAVADLGLDLVLFFDLDADGLGTRPTRQLALPPGTGPRRLAFSADGERLFVLGELAATLSSFRRSGGEFEPETRISTLPGGYVGRRSAAELLSWDDGQVLYATNRGDDSLAIIDVSEGAPRLVSTVPAGVREPRAAAVTPDGHLLVAGQDDGRIVTFSLDDPYRPRPHAEAEVPAPVCLQVVGASG